MMATRRECNFNGPTFPSFEKVLPAKQGRVKKIFYRPEIFQSLGYSIFMLSVNSCKKYGHFEFFSYQYLTFLVKQQIIYFIS